MSASSVSTSFGLSSPLKLGQEVPMVIQKQGIVSILGSDCERSKTASLRRTLSADMSSKKWLAQNGFSPMKKISSSEELEILSEDSSSSSSEKEEEEEEELEKPGQMDLWSSILSQKVGDSPKLPPPYIHPLVKRSSNSLSEKSLEICTESLGSETGSDMFSSYPASEAGGMGEDQQPPQEIEWQSVEEEGLGVVKYNYSSKKSPPRSFPPPLLSLSGGEGLSFHVHSRRENGRLVLEAVSVPSKSHFHAQRQDGRLLLTLVNIPPPGEPSQEEVVDQKEDWVEEFEEVFDNFEEEEKDNEAEKIEEHDEEEEDVDEDEDEDEENEERVVVETAEKVEKESGGKEIGYVMEQAPKMTRGAINVHRTALMMKKLMGMEKRNPTWPHKFHKGVNLVEEEEEEEGPTLLPQSLPPAPRVARLISSPPPAVAAAAASFNAYEYLWRAKPNVASMINPITQRCPPLKNNHTKTILPNSPKANENQDLLLLKGNKADYTVPLLRGCKEPKRSLLIWEPSCITTS